MVSVVVCTELSGKKPHRQVGVVISRNLGGVMVSVVVCIDLSGKKPHRQVSVGMVVTSATLGGVINSWVWIVMTWYVYYCTNLSCTIY